MAIKETLGNLEAVRNNANFINTPKEFFYLLCQFIKLILRDPTLKKFLKKVAEEGKKTMAAIKTFAKEALSELEITEKKIRNYIVNQSIINQSAIQALDVFQDRVKNNYKLNLLVVPLEQALYFLLNDEFAGHSDFVQTFGTINRINDDRYIYTAEAFPKFAAWDKKLSYFTQERKDTTWFSLNQILVFQERYDLEHYDNVIEQLIKNGVNVTQFQEEHLILMKYACFNNQKESLLFPSVEEYKHHMLQICLRAQNEFASIMSLPIQTKRTDWRYDLATRKFSYVGEGVTFRKFKLLEKDKKKRLFYGYPAEVLRVITSAKNQKKNWKFLQLFKEIIITAPEQDDSQIEIAMHDACEQINAQIFEKCDLKDFLSYDRHSVHINHQYLV